MSRRSVKALLSGCLLRRDVFIFSSLLIASAILANPPLGELVALFYILLSAWSSGAGVEGEGGKARYLSLAGPVRWGNNLVLGLLVAAAIHVPVEILVTPLVEWISGAKVDVSAFDFLRGSTVNLLIVLPIVWVGAALVEEVVFRGYLMKQIARQFGDTDSAWWSGLVLTSTVFGLAHHYQGPSGMILTGLVGFLLGYLFMKNRENLWLPVFVHGFIDTIGLTAVYLNVDRVLNDLLRNLVS